MSKFAARVLSNGRSERARAALQVFAEKSPGFGSLTLWANQVDADPIRVHNAMPRAWTDGSTVFYSERFEKLEHIREKTGLVGHETWHIAFCHPQRAMKMAKENVDFNSFICNIAMDAIVNEGLKSPGTPYDWIRMPDGSVELLELLKEVLGEDWTREEALATWSMESLYRAMMDKTPRHPVPPSTPGASDKEAEEKSDDNSAADEDDNQGEESPKVPGDEAEEENAEPDAGGKDGDEAPRGQPNGKSFPRNGGSASGHKNGNGARTGGKAGGTSESDASGTDRQEQDESFNAPSQPGQADSDQCTNNGADGKEDPNAETRLESNYDRAIRYAKEFGFTEDIKIDLGANYDPEKIESDMRLWSRRLEIARAGETTNGILRRIIADIPKSTTPWQSVLRSALTPVLMRRSRKSWEVPSRRWLAVHTLPGCEEFSFEPGNRNKRPAMRLAVCVDTSASIDDMLLAKFSAEIRAIQRLTNCEIYIIVGDTMVHDIWKLRPNDGQRNGLTSVDGKKIVFRGNGGTDFEPLLAAAAEMKPSIAVYLTDLEGPTGPKPKGFDVVWAVPENMRRATPVPEFGRVIQMQ